MKIYTKTGDMGSTGLFGGPRVAKDDDRIEAYGTVDELNAALGVARAAGLPPDVDEELSTIQSELFSIGAELATPDPDSHGVRIIGPNHVQRLEQMIDRHEATLEPLRNFILPAGSEAAARLHLARAICRRAERNVVTLVRRQEASVSEDLLIYLNRLGDLLFVLSRVANSRAGCREVQWVKPSPEAN
ncbi:MAG: cob(I)yrinic acid a,c-diamide adenosyltransferase [Planctomycetaceae bacterium]|nr:MAG: cob(I)yrinic acid a,c-diamide adenosyltransferase [Planctomycetaceae bacterium]